MNTKKIEVLSDTKTEDIAPNEKLDFQEFRFRCLECGFVFKDRTEIFIHH